MLGVVVRNLAENAIRYAGPGADATLAVRRVNGEVVLTAVDDGAASRGRTAPPVRALLPGRPVAGSRGTGLGLAIVKHVVTSAGGTVEAPGGRGRGLENRCVFPTRA